MAGEKSLAVSIQRQTESILNIGGGNKAPLIVDGIALDYPRSEIAPHIFDDRSGISPEAIRNYFAMKRLFEPKAIPPAWIAFAKEVAKVQKEKGCKEPIDLVWGLFYLTEESARAQAIGLPKFRREANGEIIFYDTEMVGKSINNVLADPELRAEYKKILAILSPGVGLNLVDKSKVKKVLVRAGITSGIFLNLGCGTGQETEEWAAKLDSFALGLDRQYHPVFYDPFWKKGHKLLPSPGFALADFAEGIPIANNRVDAAMLQSVAHHMTQASLEKGLKEALRVLKKGGYLFVAPQSRGDIFLRIFCKEALPNKQGYHFKEYRYYDLVPEDRPKPFRRKQK